MTPIFNEYRNMLSQFSLDLSSYDENKLWIDYLIIRGFDKEGNSRKIARLKINDNLEYEYKFYDKIPKNEDLLTWEELYQFHEKEILKKEAESIEVIKSALEKYPNAKPFLSTSMGKDSRLVEYLMNQVIVKYNKVFNNTTCDSPEVYKEVMLNKDIEIVSATDADGKKLSLYNLLKINGTPTRHYRWCCRIFKEEAISKRFESETEVINFLGMRNEESQTRKDYEFEKEDNRFQPYVHIFLPIRKWLEKEVWLYELHNNIPINDKYKKGYSRVGCSIVCPYYAKSTWVLDKYWYPKLFNNWHKYLDKDFYERELWYTINCTRDEYHLNWNGGLVRVFPTDEVITEFAEYKKFDDIKIAEQYFVKKCNNCGKKVNHKNEVAMNLKYHGRNTNTFLCKKCFMKQYDLTYEIWNNKVKSFKDQGCNLF